MTIDSRTVSWSQGKNDERMTPAYAVLALLPHLRDALRDVRVWCPFDTEESQFVQVLRSVGSTVIYSHISDGRDFYRWSPPANSYDVIISNPPFTGKGEIFKRAISLGKPFALLMTATWLQDPAPIKIFSKVTGGLQLLMFDERVVYNLPSGEPAGDKVTFKSFYYCNRFLRRDIVFASIPPARQILREWQKRKHDQL